MKRCEAPDCDTDFEPRRSTARYCSATCRQRAGRARKAAEADAKASAAAGTPSEHGLVRAVRLELEGADALDTVAGQLALQVARRIAEPESTGISGLSKELRALLAEATGDDGKPPEPTEEPTAEEEDEVTRARRQREEARQAAGLA